MKNNQRMFKDDHGILTPKIGKNKAQKYKLLLPIQSYLCKTNKSSLE